MADRTRTVSLKVLGDAASGTRALGKVADAADHAGSRGAKAFKSFGSVLSNVGIFSPFSDALEKVVTGLDHVREHGKSVGTVITGIGIGAAAAGALLVSMSAKDVEAHAQLKAAVEASGHSYDDYEAQVEKTTKQQERFGHQSNDTEEALRRLTQATNDPAKALANMAVVTDLAAARHISLSDAAGTVAKILGGGGGKLLKEYGVTAESSKTAVAALTSAQRAHKAALDSLAHAQRSLSDLEVLDHQHKKLTIAQQFQLRNAHDAVAAAQQKAASTGKAVADAQTKVKNTADAAGHNVEQLGKKLKGQADAAAGTVSGKMRAAVTTIEDGFNHFAQHVGPMLLSVGPVAGAAGALVESGLVGKVGKGVSKIGSGVKAVGGHLADLGSKAADVAAKAGGKLATFGKAAGGVALQVGEAAVSFVKMGAASAAAAAKVVVTAVAEKAVAAATKAWAAVQWLLDAALDANPLGLIIVAVVAVIAVIVLLWTKCAWFRTAVEAVWHAILVAVKAVASWFENTLWPTIKKVWEAIVTGVLWVWHHMKDTWTKIHLVVSVYIELVRAVIHKVITWVKTFIAEKLAEWHLIFHLVWSKIQDVVQSAVDRVMSIIDGIKHVVSVIGGAFSSAYNAIKSAMGNALSFVGSIPGKILAFFSGLGDKLWSIGSDLVDGLKRGISSAWDKVTGMLHDLVSKIPSGVKKLLGISSPSKVFAQIGQHIGHGLALGIHSTRGLVASAGAALAAAAVPDIPAVAPWISSPGSTRGSSYAAAGGSGGGVTINATINLPASGDPHYNARAVIAQLKQLASANGVKLVIPGLT